MFSENEKKEFLERYTEFIRIPSISASGKSIHETAGYLKDLMGEMGLSPEILATEGNPVVHGDYDCGSDRTLLVYNHYDVQPVDPLDEWDDDPFSARVKEGRIYGRGSSDNKGTLMARLFGIKRAMEQKKLKINLKFLFEGEEEIGSPNLEKFAHAHREKFGADAVIMEGSQIDAKGNPTITLGVKGLLYVQIEDETGKSDLHSSLAAVAPNAAWNVVQALDSIYDGRKVLFDGFYDDVRALNDDERKLLAEYPLDPQEMLQSYGVRRLRYENRDDLVRALLAEPTCNIDGMLSGYVAEGPKTVTPRRAMAKIDFRLVPDQDPHKLFEALKKHLKASGFEGKISQFGLEHPVRTSVRSKVAKAMIASAESTYSRKPVVLINGAGTQPMGVFTRLLGIPDGVSAIGVGDNLSRAHAPNESVAVQNYYKAIEHTESFMVEMGRE